MNGWDLFTWFCSIVLGVSALLIFVFFVRDAREPAKEKRERQSR